MPARQNPREVQLSGVLPYYTAVGKHRQAVAVISHPAICKCNVQMYLKTGDFTGFKNCSLVYINILWLTDVSEGRHS